MEKIRIHKLAKDLNLPSKDLMDMLNNLGFQIESHMTAVTESEAQAMMRKLAQASKKPEKKEPEKATRPTGAEVKQEERKETKAKQEPETGTKIKFDEKEKAKDLEQDKNKNINSNII